jgi:hypothetical protein
VVAVLEGAVTLVTLFVCVDVALEVEVEPAAISPIWGSFTSADCLRELFSSCFISLRTICNQARKNLGCSGGTEAAVVREVGARKLCRTRLLDACKNAGIRGGILCNGNRKGEYREDKKLYRYHRRNTRGTVKREDVGFRSS